MNNIITPLIRKIASQSEIDYWEAMINKDFGINPVLDSGVDSGHCILREIYHILRPNPSNLIKDCGISTLLIRDDMGPNKPYYPNHGYFDGDRIALNADIFLHPDLPDDFIDHRGYFLTRPQQTLMHELGHAYDEYHDLLSLKSDWLKLSDWNENYKPGLKRLIINEKGSPKIVGEWFYNPEAGFTRFYAKRNPWDDWADSFAFHVCRLQKKVPQNKINYFNDLLKKYY